MIHNIWVLSSIFLVFFILIHNPKSQNIGGQTQLFGNTRTAEETTNKITWVLILIFFISTIYISSSGTI